jgi:hypothetical protein
MSTEMPHSPTDAQLLHQYLGQRLDETGADVPGQTVIAELGEYQNQLDRLRAMIREGEASLDAGEGRELDVESLLQRVRNRMVRQDGSQ